MIIEVPTYESQDSSDGDMSQEAQALFLENLKEREARAEQMLSDAKIQSEIIRSKAVQEAESQAAEILQQAREEAERLKQEAHDQGYQEGLAAGEAAGEEKILNEKNHIIIEADEKAKNTLRIAEEEILQQMVNGENKIAEMVLSVADKILPQHFLDAPTIILPLVQEAIRKIQDQPQVTVKVCPDSYDLVLMARAELQNILDGNATLNVEADESLKPGDCIAESPNGTVDARLATQMDMVKAAVRNVMS